MNPREISELVFLVEKENNLFFKSSGVENINSEIDKILSANKGKT